MAARLVELPLAFLPLFGVCVVVLAVFRELGR